MARRTTGGNGPRRWLGALTAAAVAAVVLTVALTGGRDATFADLPATVGTPSTVALVHVVGRDADGPASQVAIRSADGSGERLVDLPTNGVTRLRSTPSHEHVLVLTRSGDDDSTDVAVLDIVAGTVGDVALPDGAWEQVAFTGAATATALVDTRSGALQLLDLGTGAVVDLAGRSVVGAASILLHLDPTARSAVLEADEVVDLVDLATGNRTPVETADGAAATSFVRWLGAGEAFEIVFQTEDGESALTGIAVAGDTTAPTVVRFGSPATEVATTNGLLTVHDSVVGRVTIEGGTTLYEGSGPFTLPLTTNTESGAAVVLDGSGSDTVAVLVDLDRGTATVLDDELPLSPVRHRVDGGTAPWFLDVDSGALWRVDVADGRAAVVGDLGTDDLPEPTEVFPGATGLLALLRTEGSVLERRAVVVNTDGRPEVWRGQRAEVVVDLPGARAVLAGIATDADRYGLVLVDLTSGAAVDLGEGFSPVWVTRRS